MITMSPLATWVTHCPCSTRISAPVKEDQHNGGPLWVRCLPTLHLLLVYDQPQDTLNIGMLDLRNNHSK